MDKITLVCTSLNPDEILLHRMLNSAKGFDEILLHIDSKAIPHWLPSNSFLMIHNVHLSIPDAYNLLIKQIETEWVCCFCDDDFFYSQGLKSMINEIHKGITADVAHFNFRISGHRPIQDIRSWFFGKEYILSEKKKITPKLLKKHNRLPAGSFFRKSAWEKVGGFQGDKFHDWNLWLRMTEAGCKFKYFDYLVYEFHRRENSAWIKQKNIINNS